VRGLEAQLADSAGHLAKAPRASSCDDWAMAISLGDDPTTWEDQSEDESQQEENTTSADDAERDQTRTRATTRTRPPMNSDTSSPRRQAELKPEDLR